MVVPAPSRHGEAEMVMVLWTFPSLRIESGRSVLVPPSDSLPNDILDGWVVEQTATNSAMFSVMVLESSLVPSFTVYESSTVLVESSVLVNETGSVGEVTSQVPSSSASVAPVISRLFVVASPSEKLNVMVCSPMAVLGSVMAPSASNITTSGPGCMPLSVMAEATGAPEPVIANVIMPVPSLSSGSVTV